MGLLPGLPGGQEDVDRVSGDTRQDALRTRAPALLSCPYSREQRPVACSQLYQSLGEGPGLGPDWGGSWDLAKELQTTPVSV